jgi:hypothetical protein
VAYFVALICAIFLPPNNPVKGFILVLGYAPVAISALNQARGKRGYLLFFYLGLGLTCAAMVASQVANIIFKTNLDSLVVMFIGFSILALGFTVNLPGANRRQAGAEAKPRLNEEQFPWTNEGDAEVQAAENKQGPGGQ